MELALRQSSLNSYRRGRTVSCFLLLGGYRSLAYSALVSFRMGISGSASPQISPEGEDP